MLMSSPQGTTEIQWGCKQSEQCLYCSSSFHYAAHGSTFGFSLMHGKLSFPAHKVVIIACRWVVSFAPSVKEQGVSSHPTPGRAKDPPGIARSTQQKEMATSRES